MSRFTYADSNHYCRTCGMSSRHWPGCEEGKDSDEDELQSLPDTENLSLIHISEPTRPY